VRSKSLTLLQSASDEVESAVLADDKDAGTERLRLSGMQRDRLAHGSDQRAVLQLRGLPRCLCEPGSLEDFLRTHNLASCIANVRVLPLDGKRVGCALLKAKSAEDLQKLAKFFHGCQLGASGPIAVSIAPIRSQRPAPAAPPTATSPEEAKEPSKPPPCSTSSTCTAPDLVPPPGLGDHDVPPTPDGLLDLQQAGGSAPVAPSGLSARPCTGDSAPMPSQPGLTPEARAQVAEMLVRLGRCPSAAAAPRGPGHIAVHMQTKLASCSRPRAVAASSGTAADEPNQPQLGRKARRAARLAKLASSRAAPRVRPEVVGSKAFCDSEASISPYMSSSTSNYDASLEPMKVFVKPLCRGRSGLYAETMAGLPIPMVSGGHAMARQADVMLERGNMQHLSASRLADADVWRLDEFERSTSPGSSCSTMTSEEQAQVCAVGAPPVAVRPPPGLEPPTWMPQSTLSV